jgi:hypothetical protein
MRLLHQRMVHHCCSTSPSQPLAVANPTKQTFANSAWHILHDHTPLVNTLLYNTL